MAYLFLTGFPSRTNSAQGGGLYNALASSGTAAASISTSVYKNAAVPQSLQFTISSGSDYCYITWTQVNGQGVIVLKTWVRFASSMPSTIAYPVSCPAGDSTYATFGYDNTNQKFFVVQYGGTKVYSANTVSADTWYELDFRATWNSTTHTIDWRLDDVAQTQYSVGSQTSTTFTGIRLGGTGGVTWAATFNFWQMALSATSGDYPLAFDYVRCLYPDADSTIDNSSDVIEDEAGNDINGTTVTAYNKVNSVQPGAPSTTNYLRVGTASEGKYASMTLSNLTAGDTPVSVMGYLAYTSATTSANNAATYLLDGATKYAIHGVTGTTADYSDGSTASLYFKSAMAALASITADAVNGLKVVWESGSDANPDPYLIDTWVEVAVTVALSFNITPADGAQAQTGDAAQLRTIFPITPADGAQAQTGDAAPLTVRYLITPGEGAQAQTGDAAGVTARYLITPADGAQAQTGDAAGVTVRYLITPAEGTQAQTGDTAPVTARYLITPADGAQAQTGDEIPVTFDAIGAIGITPADGNQAQTGDAAPVTARYLITPAEGNQTQSGDAAGVTARYLITTAEGAQAQSGDAAGVSARYLITPAEGNQAQAGDTASLTTIYQLSPAEGNQAQTGDAVGVTATYILAGAQGYQTQTGDPASITTPAGAITITGLDGYQTQTGDIAILLSAHSPGKIIYSVGPDSVFTARAVTTAQGAETTTPARKVIKSVAAGTVTR